VNEVVKTRGIGWGKKIKKTLLSALRWLVWALLLLLLVRGAALLLIPQRTAETAGAQVIAEEPAGLQVFPVLFVYEYLEWQPDKLSEYKERIKPFLASHLDSQAGWIAGAENSGQSVQNAWIYELRFLGSSRWLATIAARVRAGQQTRTLYLAIPIAYSSGGWLVSDYPALLPAPVAGSVSEDIPAGQAVSDDGGRIEKLLTGFFHAYTTKGQGDTTYYLLPGCTVPDSLGGFKFGSMESLKLYKDASGTLALTKVTLQDEISGAGFTLRYTFRLVEQDSRWYIKEITEIGV